jgi:hypothetical protein
VEIPQLKTHLCVSSKPAQSKLFWVCLRVSSVSQTGKQRAEKWFRKRKRPAFLQALIFLWWPERESNPRHRDFQSLALPTELSGQNLLGIAGVLSEPQMILVTEGFSKPRLCKLQVNPYFQAYWRRSQLALW